MFSFFAKKKKKKNRKKNSSFISFLCVFQFFQSASGAISSAVSCWSFANVVGRGTLRK